MSRVGTAVLLLTCATVADGQQPDCPAPALSSEQVKAIVDKARETTKELPPPFAEAKWSVRRQGCHYVYIEAALPEAPDRTNMFWINSQGHIVDVRPGELQCPERVLTSDELAAIVQKARATRRDLPPPIPNATTQVTRLRCLYVYTERAAPPAGRRYQAFTIDPYGDVMDVFRSKGN
jgi:hypothetical protein